MPELNGLDAAILFKEQLPDIKLLDISLRTVETHRRNVKKKLAVDSTAGLTRYAIKHGLIDVSKV